MNRRQYRDAERAPRQVPKFNEGQAVYVSGGDQWVRVLEVKFWSYSGAPYYWVQKDDGSTVALSEEYLS